MSVKFIGIRPENIKLSTLTEQGLPATVELVEELGGSRVAYCSLDGSEVAVVLPPDDENIEGATVWLTFPAQLIQCFDRITGKRMDAQFATSRDGAARGNPQMHKVRPPAF